MKAKLGLILLCFLLFSCSNDDNPVEEVIASEIGRGFKMGFTSWSYGPQLVDVDTTYSFIAKNGDIYAEHIDNKIPWKAWINNLPLPIAFTNEINGRVQRKISGKELLLSVSLFNSNRDELAEDFDGSVPSYSTLNDSSIREAYFKHIDYLVNAFAPNYLVIVIEANEFRLRSPTKWDAYKSLITDVRGRIKQSYPNLKVSESISLHNLYEANVNDPELYIQEIVSHANKNDFFAVSFYPFLKNLKTPTEFQQVLDFLHSKTSKPIAFVETAHIAENLVIPNLNVSIDGNENEQKQYLETLIANAKNQEYDFIIWWAHRDFDALWQTFPNEVKDLGQIWRDTGILDEHGRERAAYTVWQNNFIK
tara:strand:+ start:863 stop:1954 length:1092 start_codon:yes stop_codon:yes gene_type:complete